MKPSKFTLGVHSLELLEFQVSDEGLYSILSHTETNILLLTEEGQNTTVVIDRLKPAYKFTDCSDPSKITLSFEQPMTQSQVEDKILPSTTNSK
ncbi:hypothetical protein NPIL_502731 [Nephila pilipes]|uniref:Uncharacterized protein n=1 Tax=Nephila pilipes TaxID=299642 RepID=A0A8X6PZ55_NEPPI|nr:hypothetical protein NPIL_502731 [Nephila pilipes]